MKKRSNKKMLKVIIEKYCVKTSGLKGVLKSKYKADMIVNNNDLILAVREFNAVGCFVIDISWWKHRKINDVCDGISMGGYADISNEDYYWAETILEYKEFEIVDLQKNLQEVIEYYNKQNIEPNIFPAITLDIGFYENGVRKKQFR